MTVQEELREGQAAIVPIAWLCSRLAMRLASFVLGHFLRQPQHRRETRWSWSRRCKIIIALLSFLPLAANGPWCGTTARAIALVADFGT